MQVIINVLNNAKDVFIERDIKNPIIEIYFKKMMIHKRYI